MNILSNFREVFNDLILENDYNIHKLIELTGISKEAIYVYRRGVHLPSLQNLIILANAFSCSADYLLGLTDKLEYTKAKESKSFIERLMFLLDSKKTSFYTLTKALNLNSSILSKWKHGREPKLETVYKVAEYFGVSIDYLIGRSDN